MDSTMPALDKIFIGYETASGADTDHDAPKAFLIVHSDGSVEAWVDEAYLLFSKPVHWELCTSSAGIHTREEALLEARRVARSFGLTRLSRLPRAAPEAPVAPVVKDAITVVAPKNPGLALRLVNAPLQ